MNREEEIRRLRDVLQTIADHPGDDPGNDELIPMGELAREALKPGGLDDVPCICPGCERTMPRWTGQMCFQCATADCDCAERTPYPGGSR